MKVQLVVEMDQQTGAISVNGPIQNKLLCYGMLESARDAIKDFCDKQAGQKIVAPTNGDVLSISRK